MVQPGPARGRGRRGTCRTNRGRSGGRQTQRKNGERSIQVHHNMPRGRGISRRQSIASVRRRNLYTLIQTRTGHGRGNSQQVTTFGNRVVLGSYNISDP
jgi:hypothetical protein